MSDYECPCVQLGVTVEGERPHKDAETCRNALYTTVKGMTYTSAVGLAKSADTQLAVLQGEHEDVMTIKDPAERTRIYLKIARAELRRLVILLMGRS